jgi:hypothetical protein
MGGSWGHHVRGADEVSTTITAVAMSASGLGRDSIDQQTPDELQRSIRSLEQRFAEHQHKLAKTDRSNQSQVGGRLSWRSQLQSFNRQ